MYFCFEKIRGFRLKKNPVDFKTDFDENRGYFVVVFPLQSRPLHIRLLFHELLFFLILIHTATSLYNWALSVFFMIIIVVVTVASFTVALLKSCTMTFRQELRKMFHSKRWVTMAHKI